LVSATLADHVHRTAPVAHLQKWFNLPDVLDVVDRYMAFEQPEP
jgi:hypothetical protein